MPNVCSRSKKKTYKALIVYCGLQNLSYDKVAVEISEDLCYNGKSSITENSRHNSASCLIYFDICCNGIRLVTSIYRGSKKVDMI